MERKTDGEQAPMENIDYEKLYNAVKKIGFGYAFLYLNLNIGRVNLLPDWVGYLLIREACDDIGGQEPSVRLLKPLAALLAAYEGMLWLCGLGGIDFSIPAVRVVIAVVGLYFHYQLMTNLGDLAEHLHLEGGTRLYRARNGQVCLTTALELAQFYPFGEEHMTMLVIVAFVVLVLVAVAISYLGESLRAYAGQVH